MKLINSEKIQESEKEFMDTINAEMDWEAIERMMIEKRIFTLEENTIRKNGDVIVYKDTIAYQFDFEIKIPISVIVNRQGECLNLSGRTQKDEETDDDELFADLDTDLDSDQLISPDQKGKVSKMASTIADMISEINQADE